ncbi:hypothetical protein I4U23_011354 [Adineta vaga]|nr:hypothetical protein I4U23_011354 [Adineta vaga]
MITKSYLFETKLLRNEQILITGGYNRFWNTFSSIVELYNLSSNSFIKIDEMISTRVFHTSTLFNDKSIVLITGGSNSGTISFSTAEIHNITTRTFKAVGGTDWINKIFDLVCELYDPVIQT